MSALPNTKHWYGFSQLKDVSLSVQLLWIFYYKPDIDDFLFRIEPTDALLNDQVFKTYSANRALMWFLSSIYEDMVS